MVCSAVRLVETPHPWLLPECGDLCLSVEKDGARRETRLAHRISHRSRSAHSSTSIPFGLLCSSSASGPLEFCGEHAVVGNDPCLSPFPYG